jgi:hypothetical protein
MYLQQILEPIQEPIKYDTPPTITNNYISLFNDKGKKEYKVYYVKFTHCLYTDECIHNMTICCVDHLLMENKYFDITINNVRYNDIKNKGYLSYAKMILNQPICKLPYGKLEFV